jgi:hypothetical protein
MYEVRVYDGKGKLKKTISEEKVAAYMWKKQGIDPGKYRGKIKPVDYEKKNCKGCGKLFSVKTSGQVFCRNEDGPLADRNACYKNYIREKDKVPQVEHICPGCGCSFLGSKNRKYCNKPCRHGKDPKTQ